MKRIAPGVWKIRCGEPETATPLEYREFKPLDGALHELGDTIEPPFSIEEVLYRSTARGCVIELPLGRDEDLYGFGLQLKSFRQTGKKKTLRVNSDPVADTGDSHAPTPFYVSTKGYGVYVDTARYVTFYAGSHPLASGIAAELAAGKTFAPDASASTLYQSDADQRRNRDMMIEVPVAKGVDVYVFAGPTLKAAVQRYNLFSGGGCFPPLWGLGVWYRGEGKFSDKEALRLAGELRREHIPCDVFGLEPGWHTHSYPCTYLWNSEHFPTPDAFIADMKTLGYKLNLWEHVFVHPDAPFYEEIKPLSGDYPGMLGLVPDLTIKKAASLFADYHETALIDKGISGFKLDECDNSDFIGSPWSFPEHTIFPSGLDGEQMHSLLGTLYTRTMYRPFVQNNKRTYGQVRAAHALAAPFPFVLYSDLYDHRDFIRGVVNCGFSGLLWSPEVRSCDSSEDLVRRVQSVVFSPQALINAWFIPNTPWFQVNREKNIAGEAMPDRETATMLCRRYFEWRMRLLPYLYAAFARYRFEGLPPFRALVMDYPDDPEVRNIDDAYLMGDALLVAPMTAGQTQREVYLPAGVWYDFWTRQPIAGGQRHLIAAPLDTIPIFVREGSIVPLAEPVEWVGEDTVFQLEVLTFGAACTPFTLYEDDGVSFDFEQGHMNRITLTYDKDAGPAAVKTGGFLSSRYDVRSWKHI